MTEQRKIEINENATIEEFFKQWKKNAFQYYSKKMEEYFKLKNEGNGMRDTKSAITHYRNVIEPFKLENRFLADYLIGWRDWEARLDKYLDKEVERKKKQLINRIEKKVGKITDADLLNIGIDGGLEGLIIGEKGKVFIETVYAGGYNIQRLHYRTLIKLI